MPDGVYGVTLLPDGWEVGFGLTSAIVTLNVSSSAVVDIKAEADAGAGEVFSYYPVVVGSNTFTVPITTGNLGLVPRNSSGSETDISLDGLVSITDIVPVGPQRFWTEFLGSLEI